MGKGEEKLFTWFLTLAAAVVILLGLQVWLSLNAEKPKVAEARKIASADSQTQDLTEVSKPDQAVTLKWNCAEEGLSAYDIGAAHLRLVGTLCPDLESQKITVTNKTNGFTASLFFQKSQSFTTDFVDLKEGPNVIEISTENGAQGKLIKSFTINLMIF